MKRAILFNAFLLLTATAIAVADGALDVSTGFFGGTVPNATTFASPVVFTGDNSGGTGTVRIRPSDEDTQLVLCDASNNASPEVCSNWQHYNPSANAAGSFFATNLYLNSASTLACANGGLGSGYFQTYASNTQGQTVIGLRHPGGACSSANLVLSCVTTGATAATCSWGTGHTTTNDFRGPILNGGSATCNGLAVGAGSVCTVDDVMISGTGDVVSRIASTSASSLAYHQLNTSNGTAAGSFGYGNASYAADSDFADKVWWAGNSKQLRVVRTDDVAAGSVVVDWMDNATATGTTLMDLLGNGTVRPLLYGSQSNCSDGAGAAACSAAPVGGVVIDAAATTVVVSTTAVTANSRIMLQEDTSLALTGSPTCNTDAGRTYRVTARTAGTSFTITASAAPVTNPACLSYSIIN